MAFPCNNFGGQEPGTNSDVEHWLLKQGSVSFNVFGKLKCEEEDNTHALYKELKKATSTDTLGWNFAKFLCNSEGVPVKKYSSGVNPSAIDPDIAELISN